MSKYVLNLRDEQFLLSHLHHETDLYDKAMNSAGHDDSPLRWNLGNTKRIRHSLRNAN